MIAKLLAGFLFFVIIPTALIYFSVYAVKIFKEDKGNEFERYYKAKAGQREEPEKTDPQS